MFLSCPFPSHFRYTSKYKKWCSTFDCSNGWLSPRIRTNFGLRNTINMKAKVMSLSAGLIVIAHDERTNMPLKQKKSLILSLFGSRSRNANIFHKTSCVHAPFNLFLSTFPVSTLYLNIDIYLYVLTQIHIPINIY